MIEEVRRAYEAIDNFILSFQVIDYNRAYRFTLKCKSCGCDYNHEISFQEMLSCRDLDELIYGAWNLLCWRLGEICPHVQEDLKLNNFINKMLEVVLRKVSSGSLNLAAEIARDRGSSCRGCSARDLQNFYTSKRDGTILCLACFKEREERRFAKEVDHAGSSSV